MNTLQRAGTVVGLSLAVGTSAYTAERIFEPSSTDPALVAEQFQKCAAIPQENIRDQCANDVEGSSFPFTWLDCVEIGSLVTGATGVVVGFRSIKRQL